MAFTPNLLQNTLSNVSNWVLVKEITINNDVVDELIEGLNGDVDEKYMIEFQGKLTGTDGSSNDLNLYFNSDLDVNNYRPSIHRFQTDATHISDDLRSVSYLRNSILWAHYGDYPQNISSYTLVFAKSGKKRIFTSNVIQRPDSNDDSHTADAKITNYWENATDNITSMRIKSYDGLKVEGTFKVYKWKDLKESNAYTYELVKEVSNIKDLANLSMDVSDTDEIVIELQTNQALSSSNLTMGFNGDLDSANYKHQQSNFNSNNTVNSSIGNLVLYLHQTNFATNHVLLARIFPKEKQLKAELWNYNTGSSLWETYIRYVYWLNTTDTVSTINFSDVSSEDVPCVCRIFKRVQVSASTTSTIPETINSSQTIEKSGYYLVDTSNGNVTITLPASNSIAQGFKGEFKNIGNNYMNIVTQGTDTIDGQSSYSTNIQYESVTIVDNQDGNFYIF